MVSTPCNTKTPGRLQAVLDNYRQTGRVLYACELAGISHHTHYRQLEKDPVYRAAFEKVERECVQRLEDTAYERATTGGDNTLLVVLLKRFKPAEYRERSSIDVTLTVNLAERLTQARNRLIALERGDSAA